ncbi:uncharacterized protein LOC127009917 isoform X3 [Eriocheir sinensis]|uniref:uncharacterized protein LOC127009917 isoform X3 n=1 Tax=Eriocheir sinensis TaxID=95602 RepID=UPI0021C827CB|nr:uncharacterized protein LOC127009917 isoform X3 [Eriocheir sinensis]XP_050739406.1 uncharacterized protein LOC127009917 isoform X3 [Eriocheir sinensis]
MASSGSVPPSPTFPPPTTPTTPASPSGPPTPTALKLKTKFMDRHAQEGGLSPLAPPSRPPPLQRIDTTPPPKKRFCTRDFDPLNPLGTVNPPSPPQSPASQSPDPRGMTSLTPHSLSPLYSYPNLFDKWGREPLSALPFTSPPPLTLHPLTPTAPHTHTHTKGLDLSVRRHGGGAFHPPLRSVPPQHHPYHLHHPHQQQHPQYHHHHHHHRLYSHTRQRQRSSHHPLLTGTPSQIMLSDPIMSRGQQDVSLFANPTAPKKAFEIDTTQQGHSEYKQKPMSQWEYKDIVQFFINGQWGFQSGTMRIEFNFHAISGATGSELMRFSRAKFLEFSPKYGDEIYEYMQQKIASERERERERQRERDRAEAPIPLYHPNLHSPTSSYNIPSPSSLSSLSSPTTTTTTTYQNSLHHHSQPSLVCDAPARYELRFESPPQPLTRYQGVEIAGEAYSVPPTASRKTISLLPPLVAIEGREREERRERAGDAGEGRSGEQSRPVEEEVKVEPPKKRGPGRPRKPENELKKKKKKTGRLWEFIRNLLLDPETCPSLVKWENPEEGLFRFMDAEKVARRWGDRKQNREMNYEKLSRAMRYYYKTHIFEAVIGRRLVYKFGKNAKAWQPDNPNFPDIHQNLGTHRDPPPPPQPPPPPPPIHHHNDPTPQPHHHNDPTPQPHLHSDSISSLHHHSEAPPPLHHHTESTSQLRHHSDPPPPLHHHQQHQPESQYHRESSPPQISIHQGSASPPPPLTHHLHHTHTLQNLTMHHHHLQSHHNT